MSNESKIEHAMNESRGKSSEIVQCQIQGTEDDLLELISKVYGCYGDSESLPQDDGTIHVRGWEGVEYLSWQLGGHRKRPSRTDWQLRVTLVPDSIDDVLRDQSP